MTISLDAATQSLRRSISHLPDSVHTRVLEQMKADGLIDDGAIHAAADRHSLFPLTPLQAQAAVQGDPRKMLMLERIVAEAQRCGVRLDPDKPVDLMQLDADLKASNASEDQRWFLKSGLFALKMIPA